MELKNGDKIKLEVLQHVYENGKNNPVFIMIKKYNPTFKVIDNENFELQIVSHVDEKEMKKAYIGKDGLCKLSRYYYNIKKEELDVIPDNLFEV